MKIKILHWNIWFQEKAENILKTIKKLNPDILCLQEITIGSKINNKKDVGKFLAKELNYNLNFSNAHKYTNKINGLKNSNHGGNAIISKFPIIKNDNFSIINPKDVKDFPYEKRTCAVSKIKLPNNKTITIATTHSSFNPGFIENKEKIEEIKKLTKFFQKQKTNLIFTGDLNITPNSKSIKLIEKCLKPCGPNYKEPTWTTKPFNYIGFKETQLKWRIDYIFSSKDVKIINSKIIKTKYSDHLPILLEIDI